MSMMIGSILASPTLAKADKCINGERRDQYGKPEFSFQIIADLWELHLKYRRPGPLRPDDVCIMMSLLKHGRLYGQKWCADNPVDACGYLAILADVVMKEQS